MNSSYNKVKPLSNNCFNYIYDTDMKIRNRLCYLISFILDNFMNVYFDLSDVEDWADQVDFNSLTDKEYFDPRFEFSHYYKDINNPKENLDFYLQLTDKINLGKNIPTSWLYSNFEKEALSLKDKWRDFKNQRKYKASLIKSAKAKLTQEELRALNLK